MRKFIFVISLIMASQAWGSITMVAQYRLGEDDPGAVAGNTGIDPTVDSVGSLNLGRTGNPTNSTEVPAYIGSTLSMSLDGVDDFYSVSGVPTTATDNFGIEAWVKSNGSTFRNAALVYFGNTGTSGAGLFRAGSSYGFLYGGITLQAFTPVTTEWTHLAVVRDSGTTTFYVNSVSAGTSASSPRVPSGSTMIGGNPQYGGEQFDGVIDEVRVFTFNPGEFEVSDLNAAVVPASTPIPAISPFGLAALLILLAISGSFVLRRRV